MSKLKSLSLPKKLDLGKRRLIKLLDELDQLLEERAALREIEEQLRTSEEHYRQVEESQEEFETTLNDDEVDSAMDEWAKFRQSFRQSKAKAQTLIDELRAVDVVPGSIRSAEADRYVRLPRCALPKFDGDVTKFREFWDQFESSIHQQRDLSDAAKLVYLRDCLTGDALGAIAGLSAANADYQVAVRRLKERFDRPVVATRRLLLNLVGTPIREWDVKALSNHIDRNVDALTALGKDPRTEALTAAECLITVARESLPEQARIKWDEQTMEDESAQSDLSRFMQFLRNQAELMHNHRPSSLVSSGTPSSVARTPQKTTKLREHGKTATHLQVSVTDRCLVCRGSHRASDCPAIRKAAGRQRRALMRKAGLCFHCLEPGHVAKECGRGGDEKPKNGNSGEPGTSRLSERPSDPPLEKDQRRKEVNPVNVNLASRIKSGRARLQIVRAFAHGNGDRRMVVNCLFDTGAERSFIREDVAQELGLRGEKLSMTVHGFGGGSKELQESMLVHFHLSPLSGGPRKLIEALTTKTLCDDIFQPRISARGWPHLRDLGLADEEEEELTVHVVIGVDYFFRMLGSTIVRAGDDDPVAVETCLGWVICGPQTASQIPSPTVAADKSADTECDQLLRKFWELEAIGISSEEEQSLSGLEREEFERNLSFDGVRYTVRLLWKRNCSNLPNNYPVAQKRLSLVQRKLKRDPIRWREYASVIQSYLDNGWAEDAPDAGPLGRTWYLPHHAVYQKGSSGEVKCRVVFDGSARFRNISLNDLLETGPKLQADLLGIVIRFRRYQIGLQADIQKMYLQVALHEADRDVCRFLWSEPGANEPPKTYRLTRVCFGLVCSPYLAMQTIRWHAENHQVECSGALRDLLPNMYVDDLVVSCDSVADARRIAKEATELLGKGGFHLAKWASNSPAAVDEIPAKDQEPSDGSRLWKTLGILWQRESDLLTFRPPERVAEFPDTKRGVLKALASVFDPLGCLAPYTVKAKIIIQLLWQCGVAWDDPLPPETETQWRTWKEELPDISRIVTERALVQVPLTTITRLELHGFADASGKAYGTVVYLRLSHRDGRVETRLVAAKSRVAPIKCLSLPRLELMAALLCARLLAYVRRELAMKVERCVHWSDSAITLCWIKGDPGRWKPFVANRVREIQQLSSPDSWKHCPTDENPADLLSRGCSPHRLSSENLWWKGPKWLLAAEASWPDLQVKGDRARAEAEKEGRRSALVMTAVLRLDVRKIIDPTRYSSYAKLLRVTAFCLRFVNHARVPAGLRRTTRAPTAAEIEEAEAVWIRQIQVDAYGQTDLGNARMKELKEFCPYVDEKGVLRVGGRLRRANLPAETKHPMLLPHGDDVVKMIIRHVHHRQLHAGVNQTLAASRQRYWITRGRSAVKNVINQCATCRRSVGQPFGQKMSELPAERVTPTGPFRYVGVDFAGPILARSRETRHEFVKTYVCVFTCMVVRAIHLELVTDMSTNSFLRALRRFISRRGRPKLIQSDNFRTFQQAGSFLKPLFRNHNWEVVQRTLADEHIEWRFITERAPWCGGYWERLVRSVKVALTKVLGRSRADPEELRTVLCEIEARINDRPLTIVSDRADDDLALTPAHFLIGRELSALPDRDHHGRPVRGDSRSLTLLHRRWRYQRKMVEHLWSRWKREYLVTLSARGKWKKLQQQPRVGDIVLVAEQSLPRSQWALGRITELQDGIDGVARSARVKISNGMITRSVRSLILVEPAQSS
ncbi:hypothetical protein T03_7489 [Trichinella britovi]|uniref:Uncharacterized protein n=1 Tax=Trichinella britovi TaxID=45882 RepID=A0A0V1DCQ2_TRIBR|nr:hypothetical protein T03_7489 [Trichinella britovi]